MNIFSRQVASLEFSDNLLPSPTKESIIADAEEINRRLEAACNDITYLNGEIARLAARLAEAQRRKAAFEAARQRLTCDEGPLPLNAGGSGEGGVVDGAGAPDPEHCLDVEERTEGSQLAYPAKGLGPFGL